jgi:hypothetical protein
MLSAIVSNLREYIRSHLPPLPSSHHSGTSSEAPLLPSPCDGIKGPWRFKQPQEKAFLTTDLKLLSSRTKKLQ